MSDLKSIMVYDRNSRYVNLCVGEHFTRSVIRLLKYLQLKKPEYANELLHLVFPLLKNLRCPDIPFHVTHFGPLHLIGKGGYGAVYKATHMIDGIPYALKVINRIQTMEELKQARSEVAVISRLSHENIVRYITSWIESCTFVHSTDTSSPDSTPSTSSSSLYRSSELSVPTQSFSPCSVDADHPSGASQSTRGTHSTEDEEKKLEHRSRTTADSHSWRPKMFIQMEWCQSNLANWLKLRNARQLLSDISPAVPHAPVRWLMDQVVRGVAYLHSEGILHRDLKPENILLQGPPLHHIADAPCDCTPGRLQTQSPTGSFRDTDTVVSSSRSKPLCYHHLTVKICDFGLTAVIGCARSKHGTYLPALSYGSESPVDHQHIRRHSAESHRQQPIFTNPVRSRLYSSCRKPKTDRRSNVWSPGSSLVRGTAPLRLLTANLGSALYTAPEVKTDFGFNRIVKLAYGCKADIFSLGVVFLQMLYVFATLHELIAILQQLTPSAAPEVQLPLAMRQSWPHESHLVSRMLNTSTDLRPTADELLASLSLTSEFPDLFDFPETMRSVPVRHQLTLPPPPSPTDVNDIGSLTANTMTRTPRLQISPLDSCYSTNKFIDSLLWHIRSLEQELVDTRRRLARYESA